MSAINLYDITVEEFNKKDEFGRNRLMNAVINNDIDFIRHFSTSSKFLIDWNQEDNKGDTALTLAAKEGRADIVQLLCNIPEIGIDIRDKEGISLRERVYQIATENSRHSVVEVLSIHQNSVCKKLKQFIDLQAKLHRELYQNVDIDKITEGFYHGQCSGISALWGYYKKRDQGTLFSDITNLIKNWDGTTQALQEGNNHLRTLFEEHINALRWLQEAAENLLGIRQLELDKAFQIIAPPGMPFIDPEKLKAFKDQKEEDTEEFEIFLKNEIEKTKRNSIPVMAKEFEIPFVFKDDELKETLEVIFEATDSNKANDQKLVHFGGPDHAIAAMKIGDRYYAFDPNEELGEREFDSLQDLQDYIKHTLFITFGYPTENMSIYINVYDEGYMILDEKTGKPKVDEFTGSPKIYNKPFHYRKSAKELIEHFLLKNDDVNRESIYKDEMISETPLQLAVRENNVDSLSLLLNNAEIDKSKKDKQGWSALMHAAGSGDIESVKIFLTHKIGEMEALTALQISVFNNHLEIAKLLSPFISKSDPWVDLMLIASNYYQWDQEKLLDETEKLETNIEQLGNEINKQDSGGSTVLMWAAECGNAKLVELLLNTKNINVNCQNTKGYSALMLAAANGHMDVLKVFLADKKKGTRIKVNLQNQKGQSAFMLAHESQHKTALDLLGEMGARKDLKDIKGKTALLESVNNGQTESLRMIIGSPGIYWNAIDSDGRTALMLAAKHGDKPMMEILLSINQKDNQSAIDINLLDNNEYSALMHAVSRGNEEIVSLLLAREGLFRDNCFECLLKAASYGYTRIEKMLTDFVNPSKFEQFMIACAKGDSKNAQNLAEQFSKLSLEFLTDNSAQMSQGKNPLMIAAIQGRSQIVYTLDKFMTSSFLNAVDDHHLTALMLAVVYDRHNVVEALLLRDDLDLMLQNKKGMTAMQMAAQYGNKLVINAFLKKISDPDILNQMMQIARKYKHEEIIELLREKIQRPAPLLFSNDVSQDKAPAGLSTMEPDPSSPTETQTPKISK